MRTPSYPSKTNKASQGRYKAVHLAPVSTLDLPKEHIGYNKDIHHAVVENPDAVIEKRMQRASVNIRTDALEQEYAYHRISDAAYRAGRSYQRTLDYAGQSSFGRSWSSEPRVDKSYDPDSAMIHRLESAEKITRMLEETRPIVGFMGERLLRLILGDGLSLSQAAVALGDKGDLSANKKGKHITSLYAWQFRQALEALAEHWQGWCGDKKF